jgi:hypothetical protein
VSQLSADWTRLASRTHKRLNEIKVEGYAFELVERRVILAAFVFVTILSGAATVICVIKGYPWPTPSITSIASTTALIVGGRQSRRRHDD